MFSSVIYCKINAFLSFLFFSLDLDDGCWWWVPLVFVVSLTQFWTLLLPVYISAEASWAELNTTFQERLIYTILDDYFQLYFLLCSFNILTVSAFRTSHWIAVPPLTCPPWCQMLFFSAGTIHLIFSHTVWIVKYLFFIVYCISLLSFLKILWLQTVFFLTLPNFKTHFLLSLFCCLKKEIC